jgi:phosphatidylserine/phosphatidylglycerophosphate/cardiolipin synthase-like enzyme
MRRARLVTSLPLAIGLSLLACGPSRRPGASGANPSAGASASSAAPSGSIELVESAPIETTLDHADVRDAADVWPEMIAAARSSIDVAQFYVSYAPASRLEPVLAALEAAADRGVKVRLLIDKVFVATYPESIERLRKRRGVEVRIIDLKARGLGGRAVLHAKYFVVDRKEAFVGSQNFDWRALEHIQEIGVRLADPRLASSLATLFDGDWAFAGGAPIEQARPTAPFEEVTLIDGARVRLAASPRALLSSDEQWDLPLLVGRIDGARTSVDVQLLTYKPASHDGTPFLALDDALRRASARGVRVRLLISSWGAKEPGLAQLAAALAPPSQVRIITIPPASTGEIPFARVCHAKYAVFDGARAWVGTSNWEGDYFQQSRNVSVFVEGAAFARRLDGIFEDGWSSAYASGLPPASAASVSKP